MAKDKPNARQKARKEAGKKKKAAANKSDAVKLTEEDKKRIADGEFRVDEIDLLRLQRDHSDLTVWRERLETARQRVQEITAKGSTSAEALQATLDEVRNKWGLSKEHAVVLEKGERAGVVVVVEEQVAPMVPCPKCKKEMPTSFGFCGSCGADLKDTKEEDAPDPDAEQTPEPAAEDKDSKAN